jgi:hypothetical protein
MNQTLRDQLVDLSHDVRGVDLHDRILRGSRRITMRNRSIGALAGVAVLASAIVAFNAIRPSNHVQPPVMSPTPSHSAAPTPTPTPSTTPGPAVVDLRNATFEVPAFPDTPACGKGQRTFTNGVAPVAQNITLRLNPFAAPVLADVDTSPGNELLVPLICQFDSWAQEEVIALKVIGQSRYTPVGFVLGTSHFTLVWREPIEVVDSIVYLELSNQCNQACPNSEQQRRGFALFNGSFKQVSGPTTFGGVPAVLTPRDFSNTTLLLYGLPIDAKAWSGSVRVVNGTGKCHLSDSSSPGTTTAVTVTVGAITPAYFTLPGFEGTHFFVILTVQTPTDQFTVLAGFRKDPANPNGPAGAFPVVTTHDPGITAIGGVTPGTDLVTVAVTTVGGQENRTYRPNETGWERVA